MRGVRQQGLHVAIKERAKSTIFTQYLSHEDTKDLMKMGSNMEDWWRLSKKTPDDVIVKFIKSGTTQKMISLQASVVVQINLHIFYGKKQIHVIRGVDA